MNITNIAHIDCAGICDKFKKVFDKHTYHNMRNIIMKPSHLNYDVDLTPNNTDVIKVLEATDVFIFHVVINEHGFNDNLIMDWFYEINGVNIFKYAKYAKKKIVFFLNGSNTLRKYYQEYNSLFNSMGIPLMASTPDLVNLFPKAFYAPAPLDLNGEFYNLPINKRGQLSMGHFPTDVNIKNTYDLIEYMKNDNPNLIVEVLSNLPNIEVLNIKREIHMTFDHLQGYYGVNSLESAALANIVFVKMNGWNKKLFCSVAETDTVPFHLVDDMNDLKLAVDKYISDPVLVGNKCVEAREWMFKYWNGKKHSARMSSFLEGI